MGYESEPLPSYNNVRTRCYFIMLSYIYSTSTSQIRLPRFDPTISSSGSSLASAPPGCRVHELGRMTPFPLSLSAVSEFTSVWSVIMRITVPPLPGNTPTPRPLKASPSYLWSVYLPDGENPPGPSTSSPSPLNFHCHTSSLTVPLNYTSSHGPVMLLPSLSTPSKSPLTVSALSLGSETPTSNHYC